MNGIDITIDQILTIGGLGSGPYGGGDVVRWSPNGMELLVAAAIGGELGLWLIPRAGGFPRRVTTAPIALPFLASPMQSWSPDGRLVAYLAEHAGATELWLWDRATGRQRPLTRLGNHLSGYSWAPDGARVLYVRLDEHWADHEVVSIAAAGGDEHVIATDQDFFDYHYGRTFGSPIVSSDGRTALFRSHRSGWINYWAVPTDGGEPRQLCPQASDQSGAAWSPDGRRIAFISNQNGTLALWLCDADGSNARALITPELGVCQAPAWSPDGATIAFLQSSPTDTQDLWTIDVASGAAARLTDSLPVGLRGRLSTPEKIAYPTADQLTINAYLYRPARQERGARCPAVLLIHGGPTSQFYEIGRAHV